MAGTGAGRRNSGRNLDARSLGALGAIGDLELHALAFLQAAEALGVDGREVDEHVLPTVLGRDETEALGVVEPLDRTETHCWNLWKHGQGAPDRARTIPLAHRPGARKVSTCLWAKRNMRRP